MLLRKNKFLIPGAVIVGLISALALLSSCYPTDTTTPPGGSSTTSFLVMIGFIVVLFGLMYFLTIRPQRKRQQDQAKMIQALHRGDRVVTIGGLYGTVESVSEDSVVIRVESGTTMRFVKSAIANRVTEQTPEVR